MSQRNGDYSFKPVRAAAILTNSYVAGTTIGPLDQFQNQLNVLGRFTKGSLDSLEVKIEFSHDDVTYYQETFGSISGATDTLLLGEHTLVATGNLIIETPISYRFIKISAKGTGTVTASSLTLDAIIAQN